VLKKVLGDFRIFFSVCQSGVVVSFLSLLLGLLLVHIFNSLVTSILDREDFSSSKCQSYHISSTCYTPSPTFYCLELFQEVVDPLFDSVVIVSADRERKIIYIFSFLCPFLFTPEDLLITYIHPNGICVFCRTIN